MKPRPGVTQRVFVFNGDADGLCALQQLHLAEAPAATRLVTGPKRRIDLVREVDAGHGDEVTVMDVSLAVNRDAVRSLLEAGARVRYFDHHDAGEVPRHERLQAFIDPSPQICSSLIVDRYLGGKHAAWAIVGAFGDNLDQTAHAEAAALGLAADETDALRELGTVLNYNAYGESLADLHFAPATLHRRLASYDAPLAFVREDAAFVRLREGYLEDIARGDGLAPCVEATHAAFYVLPDAPWARRVGGMLASRLARRSPRRAHAVAFPLSDGGWQVSVRAPLRSPHGAAALCRAYASGGGREGAGGINHLPRWELENFAERFIAHFLRAA